MNPGQTNCPSVGRTEGGEGRLCSTESDYTDRSPGRRVKILLRYEVVTTLACYLLSRHSHLSLRATDLQPQQSLHGIEGLSWKKMEKIFLQLRAALYLFKLKIFK